MSLPLSQRMVIPSASASRRSRRITLRCREERRFKEGVEADKALIVPVKLGVDAAQPVRRRGA